MRILVTYAVQGEFTELKFPGLIGEEEVQIGYLRTGIGKVKSAFYLAEAINQGRPDLVVNIGTAGTIRHRVGDILVCRRFIDRDMQKLNGLGVEWEIDSAELLAQKGYCLHWDGNGEGVCNTGDSFLTELLDVQGDVVDMEAYAQAMVCRAKEVPFISVKYVTDIIGQNSVKHWEDKLADARKGLGEFLEALGGVVRSAN
ncbi:nucleosidase [uncultured Bacteroides sp.]|uniref:5'-methylthioadenosine/S-adenosylhomocysteine nucleosidase family protein n=1 Tax=uncultured Bacteroides sp. TaxID=162156 RepID=UPI0023BF555B|nr:nucleosidase [uncultured Bacteroides sp.]MDE5702876.1 nucleosidase [Bacteroides sp.]MDE6172160.1 nucleosidase [Bacteroides sp.]